MDEVLSEYITALNFASDNLREIEHVLVIGTILPHSRNFF